MLKYMKILPVLGLFLLGACAATIPESSWKPSSIDEMMGGKQVATFDATRIRRSDGREIPYAIDIDLNKGELVHRNLHPDFTFEIGYRKFKKNGSGYCVQRLPSDKEFDSKKWWCYSVRKATTRDGKDVFRILTSKGNVLYDDVQKKEGTRS